jgi:DNA-directed RNA polymerase specialized sigma24 family protein
MTEGGGGEKDALLARAAAMRHLDWGSLTNRLIAKACRLGQSPTAAKDLAQDTVIRMIKIRGEGWDPAADPTAFRYLLRKLSRRIDALYELKERRAKLRPIETDSDKVDAVPPESDRGAEGELVSGEAALRNIERLRESLADSPLALAIVDLCVAHGQLEPREVAARLGVPVKEVYVAEAKIQRHTKKVRRTGSDPDLRADDEGEAGDRA